MKTYLYIAFLCLPLMVFFQQENPEKETIVNAEFTIGRQGQDCAGRGLCSFNTSLNKSDTSISQVYYKNNTLILAIDRLNIDKVEETKLVGKQLNRDSKESDLTFVMEEALVLDATTIADLKIPNSLTKIAKGSYPIIISKNSLIIIINLE